MACRADEAQNLHSPSGVPMPRPCPLRISPKSWPGLFAPKTAARCAPS